MLKLFILLLAFSGLQETSITQRQLTGKWTNEDHSRVIEFVANGDKTDAVIRKAKDTGLIDKKQMTGLTLKEQGLYTGTLHLIKKGKSFGCSIRIISDSAISIEVSRGLAAKKEIWTNTK